MPGLIRLAAPVSRLLPPGSLPWSSKSDTPGDIGPIWSSAMGGGEGSRGEDDGDCADMVGGVEDVAVPILWLLETLYVIQCRLLPIVASIFTSSP